MNKNTPPPPPGINQMLCKFLCKLKLIIVNCDIQFITICMDKYSYEIELLIFLAPTGAQGTLMSVRLSVCAKLVQSSQSSSF